MKPSTIATSASSHSRVKTDSTVPPRTTRSAGSSPRATARRRARPRIGAPYRAPLGRRNGRPRRLRPELVPGRKVVEVLAAVHDPAVLELEDGAAVDVKPLAVPVANVSV